MSDQTLNKKLFSSKATELATAQTHEQALAETFALFNRLSEDLTQSYRELELRVEQLSEELSAARSERLVQLAEKERLANRLSQLLDALPGAVIVTDDAGMIREANPSAVDFLGGPLIGSYWKDVAQNSFVGGVTQSGEVQLTDGRRLNLTARALGSEPGDILLLQDVTEERTLQEELERHQRLAAMGEMIAGLAHQIRTPLSSVLLYLSHLEQKNLDDHHHKDIMERIRGRISHLEGMVDGMLRFAKGGISDLIPIPLETLVSEFEELVAIPVNNHKARLQINWVESSLRTNTVLCQRASLTGALVNLVNNALRAGGRSSELWLQVWEPTSGQIALSLEDSGPGIDQTLADRVFEPFFTTDSEGTGLGLPVVRSVMEAHGGEVILEPPKRLCGARFTLILPKNDDKSD